MSGDLLSWFGNSAHSHWSEYVCYEMHMLHLKEYGGNSFRMEDCTGSAGISYNLTPQLQQYGKGTYTLTFAAKADSAASMQIMFGANRMYNYKKVVLTTGWQEFKFTYTINENIDPALIKNACIVMYANESDKGIEIRNAKLTYNG